MLNSMPVEPGSGAGEGVRSSAWLRLRACRIFLWISQRIRRGLLCRGSGLFLGAMLLFPGAALVIPFAAVLIKRTSVLVPSHPQVIERMQVNTEALNPTQNAADKKQSCHCDKNESAYASAICGVPILRYHSLVHDVCVEINALLPH